MSLPSLFSDEKMQVKFWLLFLMTLQQSLAYQPIFSPTQLEKRSLKRFTISHEDNTKCWNRSFTEDGFISPIDTHNHFRPFGGPPVPFPTYLQWMKEHGILFSTMFGIGQLLKNKNPNAKPCCYYMHCPTPDYKAVPDPTNDILNAQDYKKYKSNQTQMDMVHLTLSATYPNLQEPEDIIKILDEQLEAEYPDSFAWAGEINVFKHALSANGFFSKWRRVDVGTVKSGAYDNFMTRMASNKWPVTLHCDLGCDKNVARSSTKWEMLSKAYRIIEDDCEPPQKEKEETKKPENIAFWKQALTRRDASHYNAFFNEDHSPKQNFRKIQHLQVWDAILSRYPDTIIVWAHIGLSIELRNLHPQVHSDIMANLFDKYPNLHADVSWDILAKLLLMNFKSSDKSENYDHRHEDLDKQTAAFIFNQTHVKDIRQKLHDGEWLNHKDHILRTSTKADQTCKKGICGPTHAMALYLDILETYSDRFITGTDFVASLGTSEKFPGEKTCSTGACPSGCMKDKANHARQVTDTSSINIFLSDEAFRKIVLGENFFKITGLSSKYTPPLVCGMEDTADIPLVAIVGVVCGIVILCLAILAALGICFCLKNQNAGDAPGGQFISSDGDRGHSPSTAAGTSAATTAV